VGEGGDELEQQKAGFGRAVFFDQVKGWPQRLGKIAQKARIRAVDRA
jgi:hypothetical protein